MSASIPALVFASLIAVAILFQLALAAGLPWGSVAMGGRFPGKLPRRMRLAALVQAVILLVLGGIVLVRAGMIVPGWYSAAESAIWFVVAFSALSVVLNVITKSKWERRIWAPVALALLASSVLVALSR